MHRVYRETYPRAFKFRHAQNGTQTRMRILKPESYPCVDNTRVGVFGF